MHEEKIKKTKEKLDNELLKKKEVIINNKLLLLLKRN